MAECAFLFPGQASQTVGMGRDLSARFPLARATFEEADRVLGFPLSECCFAAPEEELNRTDVTQPAVFVHSMAVWRVLRDRGIAPVCVAGHSLGEYSAVVAAGALEFAEGLKLVRTRGQLMQQVAEQQPGSMTAIIGLDERQIGELCEQVAELGIVVPANFNAPGQLVVSGEKRALERLGELALQGGARRVLPLAVSGAFHSPLMKPAARRLEELLCRAPIQAPQVPVITNVAARPVEDAEELRRHLIAQITRPVRWTESIQCLSRRGIRLALEVGPGSVLKGLVRRIAPEITVYSVGQAADLAAAVAASGALDGC